ncbi:hypothetical protein F0562_025095 [Nyssa sinensis]|uniref:Uncharacterized protein n=1 Tax=Nyssa sinensis TaxID=561372 RepID=A0A5J5BEL6_9ASTE|nr:hypothetical protein F0562_025095 [Nyssa sinensis]
MSEADESRSWEEEFETLVGDKGMRYAEASSGGGGVGIAAAVEDDFGVGDNVGLTDPLCYFDILLGFACGYCNFWFEP